MSPVLLVRGSGLLRPFPLRDPKTAWRVGGGEGGAPGPPPRRPGGRGLGGWGARRGRGGHAVGRRAVGGRDGGGCRRSRGARRDGVRGRNRGSRTVPSPLGSVSLLFPVGFVSGEWMPWLEHAALRFFCLRLPCLSFPMCSEGGGAASPPPGWQRRFIPEGSRALGAGAGVGGAPHVFFFLLSFNKAEGGAESAG